MADLRIVDAPDLPLEELTEELKIPTGGKGNYAVKAGDVATYVVQSKDLANKTFVNNSSNGVKQQLDIHKNDKNNPHGVTKDQIGLGNVDNTADLDKPVSDATNAAIVTATKDKADNSYVSSGFTRLEGLISASGEGYLFVKNDEERLLLKPVKNAAVKVLDTHRVWFWQTDDEGVTGTWTDSGVSELDEANQYTDNKVESIGFKSGLNIANLNDVINGRYVYWTNGEEGTNPDFVATGFYKVESNTKYQVPSFYKQQFAFYDKYRNYISGQLKADNNNQFVTPSNAKYIRLSISKDQLSTFMLCKADEYPSGFVAFSQTLESLQINSDQVKNLMDDVKNDIGIYPINLINPNKVRHGYYVYHLTGEEGEVDGYSVLGSYEIKPDKEYQFSEFYAQQGVFLDERGVYISGFERPINHKITSPSNAKYIKISVLTPQIPSLVFAETEIFPSSYVSNSAIRIPNLVLDPEKIQTIEIYTSSDENDTTAQFKGKNAIQRALDSISDGSSKKRYRIIDTTIHELTQANEYIGQRGYPTAILAKDHVDIIGNGKSVVFASLPHDDADIGASVDGNTYPRNMYQTLYTYAEDSLIQGMTFIAQNTRYALHLDNANGANKTHRFKDVNFVFKGDKGSQQAIGIGTSSGEETYFEGGYCHSDFGVPFYCHNNSKFSKQSLISLKDYKFSSNQGKGVISLQSDGSLVKDKIEMIGCSFGGSAYIIQYGELWLKKNTTTKNDSFDHAEWTFSGYGNEPFLFENSVGGDSLRFVSVSAGEDQTIRFDKTSSAFPLLIKNNQTDFVNIYNNGRDYIDGYIVQDGSTGIQAYAYGCLDLSESAGAYDEGVVYTSMGKRLGDCSTNNKTLVVIVSGTRNTITFNKNYTSMSNSEIISEINAQMSGCTANFVSYGRDYYPMFSDVTDTVFNTTSTAILKGSVVTKSGGTVRLAQTGDKIYGVALEDIPVVKTTSEGVKKGQGRVLKRGYISANPAKSHFVRSNVHNPTVGTRFKVVDGGLIDDYENGVVGVDIDTGVISINC